MSGDLAGVLVVSSVSPSTVARLDISRVIDLLLSSSAARHPQCPMYLSTISKEGGALGYSYDILYSPVRYCSTMSELVAMSDSGLHGNLSDKNTHISIHAPSRNLLTD